MKSKCLLVVIGFLLSFFSVFSQPHAGQSDPTLDWSSPFKQNMNFTFQNEIRVEEYARYFAHNNLNLIDRS